jgi:quinol monooxygenase YgiN
MGCVLGHTFQSLDGQGAVSWFAFHENAATFGVFDTFEDEQGRQAHLTSRTAAALGAAAQTNSVRRRRLLQLTCWEPRSPERSAPTAHLAADGVRDIAHSSKAL